MCPILVTGLLHMLDKACKNHTFDLCQLSRLIFSGDKMKTPQDLYALS